MNFSACEDHGERVESDTHGAETDVDGVMERLVDGVGD